MTIKHTPGPWRVEVDEKGDVGVFANDYGLICYPVEDQYQENARLIAAAPEMLALLRGLAALDTPHANGCQCVRCEPVTTARALLATIDGTH